MNKIISVRHITATLTALVLSLTVVSGLAPAPFEDRIPLEELITKHLDSIGKAEARAANKSRVIQGGVLATVRIGGRGQSQGGSVMASQGPMSLIGMIFGPQEYSNEKAGFDGKRLTLGELTPGSRTNLGGFLLTHDIVFKEGLLGGTLSTAWPFLNLSNKNPKLKYGGSRKIDGREVHMIRYEPRNGGNLQIRLFFDSATFRHVRTEYQQDIAPSPVSDPSLASKQKETHLKLSEDFSDFKEESGLMLPHTYKLQLTFDTSNNALLQDWVLNLRQFLFNKEIDPKQFDMTVK